MLMLEESESAAKRLGVLPAMTPETQPLIQDHEKSMERLKASSGKKFDRQYLAHEIEMHTRVLETAGSLAQQTQDPQLTKMVAGARPMLQAHLKAAQRLLAEQQ